jgi:hypothetical protein
MVPHSVPLHSRNPGKIQGQIQAPNHRPDRPCAVVLIDELLYINGT